MYWFGLLSCEAYSFEPTVISVVISATVSDKSLVSRYTISAACVPRTLENVVVEITNARWK